MNRFLKNTLALFLCVLMLSAATVSGGLTLSAHAKTIREYAQGDLVTFGWYPQARVNDSAVIQALGAQPATWHSYGYYTGSGSYSDGNMAASGYMEYADVIYGAQKYRGVRFSQYRPYYTGLASSAQSTFQDENGYNQPGSTYWFEWEPLRWRVLEPTTGLVLCESIIDSQPFNNYVWLSGKDAYGNNAYWGDARKAHYANNYAESSLRQWLNDTFYNTAFSAAQQNMIMPATLDNSAFSPDYSAYNSAATTDKISLLSFGDMKNTAYGFDSDEWSYDAARQAQGSDYAKCQGLYVDSSSGYSRWWLRSAGYYSDLACSVEYDGWLSDYYYGASNVNFGVRPAFKLNLTSEMILSDVSEAGCIEAIRYRVPAWSGMQTTLIFKYGANEYRIAASSGAFTKENVPLGTYKVYAQRKNCLCVYLGEYNNALGEFTDSAGIALPQGDVNGDGVIDIADVSILLAAGNYGAEHTDIDLDGDGEITIADITVALQAQNYGKTAAVIG